jgi:hypothetical protein
MKLFTFSADLILDRDLKFAKMLLTISPRKYVKHLVIAVLLEIRNFQVFGHVFRKTKISIIF